MTRDPIIVAGGGLAGSEAAWQIAQAGFDVRLFEMRPVKATPAHKTSALAEIVVATPSNPTRKAALPGCLRRN